MNLRLVPRTACVFACLAIAGAPLLQAADSEKNARVKQIRQLGNQDSQAIATLAQFLTDPDRDVRVETVRAIVKIGTDRSLEPLSRATADSDSEVDIRATDGLVNFYLPGYVAKGALSGPLTRGVRQVKGYFAARNEQVIAPDITIRPEVAQALAAEIAHASSAEARTNAARAAGILRDEPAVPSLEAALRSKETDLILESLYALQKIADPQAGPGVTFLTRDLDNRVQMAALETVGVLRSLSSAPDVRAAFRDPRNEKIRRSALQALALLAIPGDRATFQQYAGDSDPALRAAAIEGLGRIREPEDFQILQTAYDEKDADWRVHLAAAFGMVNEGKVDTDEFSPLTFLVQKLDTKGQEDVAKAYLVELCRRDPVRQGVAKLLPEATADQKIAICDALGASRGEDAIPALTALQKDLNSGVALAASRAIRMIQSAPRS